MEKIFKIFALILLFNLSLAEASDNISAYRKLDTDYTVYQNRIVGPLSRSPMGISRLYDGTRLDRARSWESLKIMQDRFEDVRDFRFLVWRPQPNRIRRISWNYPDDGCYARASLAIKNFFRWSVPTPNKIFAFGNLRVRTRNSPRGIVGWWYHVAPIVEVDGVKFVLDPAIDRQNPLELEEWLERMGPPNRIKVAICGSGTYSPKDNCDKETNGVESQAKQAQQTFLGYEWNRMVRSGREGEL